MGGTLGGTQAQHPVLVLLLDLQKLHEQGGGAVTHEGRPAPGAGAEAAALAAVRAVATAELVRGRALHVPSMGRGAEHDEEEQEDASYPEGESKKMLFVHADGWLGHDLRHWARRLGAHTLPAVVIWDPVAEAAYLLQPSNVKYECPPPKYRMLSSCRHRPQIHTPPSHAFVFAASPALPHTLNRRCVPQMHVASRPMPMATETNPEATRR